MRSSILLLVGLLMLAQSCKKSDIQQTSPSTVSSDKIDALRQAVATSTGLPLEKVSYSQIEKRFIVDGDALVSLQDAEARFASSESRTATNSTTQRRYDYIISSSKTNVTIYYDVTVPVSWMLILDQAIANWNSAGSAIVMSRVSIQSSAATTVTATYNNATSVIATASMPDYYGNPGNSLTINTYYSTLSDAQKLFALTHELGHSIGFNHTDGTYGTLIHGTPRKDAGSIMESVCSSWVDFSDYDLIAVRTLYPTGG